VSCAGQLWYGGEAVSSSTCCQQRTPAASVAATQLRLCVIMLSQAALREGAALPAHALLMLAHPCRSAPCSAAVPPAPHLNHVSVVVADIAGVHLHVVVAAHSGELHLQFAAGQLCSKGRQAGRSAHR
jgi:hypothetical protein